MLGQGLGAPAFRLVGLRIGDAGGDLVRQEPEEPAIALVEEQIRVEPGDEEAGDARLALREERDDHGADRRPVPRAARQAREARRKVLDQHGAALQLGRGERPDRVGLGQDESSGAAGCPAAMPARATRRAAAPPPSSR